MSGILAPIKSLLARIGTIKVENQDYQTVNMPVRIWNDHLSEEKKKKLYSYPKPWVFLEIISPVTYEQMGVGFKNADLGIRVHLIHEFYDAIDGTMEQDLIVFGLRDQIVGCLSQFEPDGCNELKMVSESMDTDHDQIYHYVLDFVGNYVDSKGSPWDDQQNLFIDGTITSIQETGQIVAPTLDYAGTPPENIVVQNSNHNPYRGKIPK